MDEITAEFDRMLTDAALPARGTMAAIKAGKPEVLISDSAARAAFLARRRRARPRGRSPGGAKSIAGAAARQCCGPFGTDEGGRQS